MEWQRREAGEGAQVTHADTQQPAEPPTGIELQSSTSERADTNKEVAKSTKSHGAALKSSYIYHYTLLQIKVAEGV